jgi:hypothetical protein
MHMHTHNIYIHLHIYIYIHTYTHTYIQIHTHICMNMHIFAASKEPNDTLRVYGEHMGHVNFMLGKALTDHKKFADAQRIYQEALLESEGGVVHSCAYIHAYMHHGHGHGHGKFI